MKGIATCPCDETEMDQEYYDTWVEVSARKYGRGPQCAKGHAVYWKAAPEKPAEAS